MYTARTLVRELIKLDPDTLITTDGYYLTVRGDSTQNCFTTRHEQRSDQRHPWTYRQYAPLTPHQLTNYKPVGRLLSWDLRTVAHLDRALNEPQSIEAQDLIHSLIKPPAPND